MDEYIAYRVPAACEQSQGWSYTTSSSTPPTTFDVRAWTQPADPPLLGEHQATGSTPLMNSGPAGSIAGVADQGNHTDQPVRTTLCTTTDTPPLSATSYCTNNYNINNSLINNMRVYSDSNLNNNFTTNYTTNNTTNNIDNCATNNSYLKNMRVSLDHRRLGDGP